MTKIILYVQINLVKMEIGIGSRTRNGGSRNGVNFLAPNRRHPVVPQPGSARNILDPDSLFSSTPANSRGASPGPPDNVPQNPLVSEINDEVHQSSEIGAEGHELVRPLAVPEFISAEVVNQFVRDLINRVDYLETQLVFCSGWQENAAAIVENAMSCIAAVLSSVSPFIDSAIKLELSGLTIALTKVNSDLVERRVKELTVNKSVQQSAVRPPRVPSRTPGLNFNPIGSPLSQRAAIHPLGAPNSQLGEIVEMLKGIQLQIGDQQRQILTLHNNQKATEAAMNRYERSVNLTDHFRPSRSRNHSPTGQFRDESGRIVAPSRSRHASPSSRRTEPHQAHDAPPQSQDIESCTFGVPRALSSSRMYSPGGGVNEEGFRAALGMARNSRNLPAQPNNADNVREVNDQQGIGIDQADLDRGFSFQEQSQPQGNRGQPNLEQQAPGQIRPGIGGINNLAQSRIGGYVPTSPPDLTYLSWVERNLVRVSLNLINLLVPDCSSSVERNTLMDITKHVLPGVEQDCRDVSKALTDYLRDLGSREPDGQTVSYAEFAINSCRQWVSGMRRSVRDRGLHGKGLGSQINKDLGKFGPTSEISIFEFLQRFENKTEEYPDKTAKARMLYDYHLESQVKQEVQSDSNNYDRMVATMLNKYGDLNLIANNFLRPLRKLAMIDQYASEVENLAYFRTLLSTCHKIDHLYTFPQVKKADLDLVVYDQNFMCRLFKSLPQKTKQEYYANLRKNNLSTVPLRGPERYKILITTIKDTYNFFDEMVRIEDCDIAEHNSKPKANHKRVSKNQAAAVYAADEQNVDAEDFEDCSEFAYYQDLTSDDDDPRSSKSAFIAKASVGNANISKVGQSKSQQHKGVKNRDKSAGPPRSGIIPKFSCVIPSHRHGIQTCPEFFALDPDVRHEYRMKAPFRMCCYCLQSGACSIRRCEFFNDVPKVLICSDCVGIAKKFKRLPYNIFTCKNKQHKRPDKADVVKALASYLPDFSRDITTDNIFMSLVHSSSLTKSCNECPNECVCPSISKSGPISSDKPIPNLDTSTGKEVKVPDDKVVKESSEHSFVVMQLLQMKSEQVLVFFDRGATCHLIDGALAEKLELKIISQDPETIGTAGDKSVLSEYGKYQFRLGPVWPERKFHELTAIGLENITTEFPKYDLSIISKEYKQDCKRRNVYPEPTPPYIGGQRAGLLIGVRDFSLEPTVLFRLPNGLAVLRSPIKDCHGTFLCFGGPHAEFSRINRSQHGSNVNGVLAFLSQVAQQYRQSVYPILSKITEGEEYFEDVVYTSNKIPVSVVKETSTYTPDTVGAMDPDYMPSDEGVICGFSHHCDCDPAMVYKAKIPLQRQRVLLDNSDSSEMINFRCPVCAKCRCASNPRERLLSVVEQIEQDLIEKSVTVDLVQKRCRISLPFTKNPAQFLSKKHQGSDNWAQAERVYQSQCRKGKEDRLAMIDVFNDLIDRGFVKKLSDVSSKAQDIVSKAEFRHYMAWRSVSKMSSSTPIRLVVDPSMTGLNLILPKGMNQLNKIADILLRTRTKKFLWSTDISKLYNQLVLEESSYPYQLLLFGNLLDPSSPPETYVLVVGWYGVITSGNQAGYALEELARLHRDTHPLAYEALVNNRYVDDVLTGGQSLEIVNQQVSEVKQVLSAGGFQTKFTVYSGQVPEVSAGAKDGCIGMLGLKWNVLEDKISPGFTEINFQRKRRGLKPPNPFEVKTPEDVRKLLENKEITRRMVIGKISELYDPNGLFEAFKVQLKLEAKALNGLDWDEPLSPELQLHWAKRFEQFLDVPGMKVDRCIVPDNAVNDKIRLICVNDAAASAGGCAIYGGYELSDGSFSCNLLASKSRLMDQSVPRNELESLRLSASLALDVKNALGSLVERTYFFTDSMIAMCWALNTKKKLRMFVLNRVTEIRSLVQLVVGMEGDDLPIFHIEGNLNVADLLTKQHNVSPLDIVSGSTWEAGYNWMTYPLEDMNFTKFSDISVPRPMLQSINEECFPEGTYSAVSTNSRNMRALADPNVPASDHCSGCTADKPYLPLDSCYGRSEIPSHCDDCQCENFGLTFFIQKGKGQSEDLINIVELGWKKGLKILGDVMFSFYFWYHKVHPSEVQCKMCMAIEACNSVVHEIQKYFQSEAKDYLFRLEAKHVEQFLGNKKSDSFKKINGIYYFNSRIENEIEVVKADLDENLYFDNMSISGYLPVVLASSLTYFALIMFIHLHVRKHSGVEITYREACKTVYALNNPRKVIQHVRKHCPKCRLIRRKTLQLEMGYHPAERFLVCPPFYASQCDVVFGFKSKPHKNSRTTSKAYALVVVCLVTSATNILCLEGLETQDVVQAIERHASRYGCPAVLFVDNGTQLVNLKYSQFSVRDADCILRDNYGMRVEVPAAKSHEARGRVERKIRTLRDMLKQVLSTTDVAMTCLGWETVFAKIASSVDDIPIARCDRSATSDPGWDLLTPNRLKLGRNNSRSIEGTLKITEGNCPFSLVQKIHNIYQHWYQLLLNRLHHLIPRPGKWSRTDPVQLGDIVVFLYNESISQNGVWKLGRVVKITHDGRRVDIEFPVTKNKSLNTIPTKRVLTRSPRDICLIHGVGELQLNSQEYLESVKKLLS